MSLRLRTRPHRSIAMAALNPRGRFVWHELMTTDPRAAERFYAGVTKWGVTPFPDDPSYRMWTVGKTPIGGIMDLPQEARAMGAPSQWLPYVHVPSVDDSVRLAESRGARVYTQPQDIPNVGRFAVLADPWGATFAVFTSPNPMGHDNDAEIGEFSWHELTTDDVSAAFDFYQALFGWEKRHAMDMGPAGVYQLYGRGGRDLGGIYKTTPDMGGRSRWLCYVRVPSADAAAASVTAAGGRVFHAPSDVPGGGRIAMCIDPQGAAFAVHATAVAVKAAPKETVKKAAKKAAKKSAKKAARPARKGAKSARKSAKRRPAKRPAKRVAKKAKRAGKAKRRR